MSSVKELQRWAATLISRNNIAVDDGGLTLVELDKNNQPTGAYFEIGGIPLPKDKES